MFKFFKIKKEEPVSTEIDENNNIAARIQYIMPKDSESTIVDVELGDYDEQSIEALCDLLDILSSDAFFVETINIIQSSLIRENKQDLLIKIFTRIGDSARRKLLDTNKQDKKDEPCIKPSDMIK